MAQICSRVSLPRKVAATLRLPMRASMSTSTGSNVDIPMLFMRCENACGPGECVSRRGQLARVARRKPRVTALGTSVRVAAPVYRALSAPRGPQQLPQIELAKTCAASSSRAARGARRAWCAALQFPHTKEPYFTQQLRNPSFSSAQQLGQLLFVSTRRSFSSCFSKSCAGGMVDGRTGGTGGRAVQGSARGGCRGGRKWEPSPTDPHSRTAPWPYGNSLESGFLRGPLSAATASRHKQMRVRPTPKQHAPLDSSVQRSQYNSSGAPPLAARAGCTSRRPLPAVPP